MKRTKTNPTDFDKLYQQLGQALVPSTVESAKALLAISLNKRDKAWIKKQGDRFKNGRLTPEESLEFQNTVRVETMLTKLQATALQLLEKAAKVHPTKKHGK